MAHLKLANSSDARFRVPCMAIVLLSTVIVAGVITRDVKQSIGIALCSLPGLLLAQRWQAYQSQRYQVRWQTTLGHTLEQQETRLLDLERYEAQLLQAIAVAQAVNQDLQEENQSLKVQRFRLRQTLGDLRHQQEWLGGQVADLQDQKQQLEQELTILHQEVAEDLTPSGIGSSLTR